MTSALLAGAVALALMAHLAWLTRTNRNKAIAARAADASSIAAVIDHTTEISNGAVGVVTWAGSWKGERVQVRTIVDTLAVRKLPVRWLSVSITEKVDLAGTFDMMMRPGAPTTFSNFDHLEHTLPKVAGFPAEAVVRTDRRRRTVPLRDHRRPSRRLFRRSRQGVADHAKRHSHRLAAGRSRSRPLRRVPAGRVRQRRD